MHMNAYKSNSFVNEASCDRRMSTLLDVAAACAALGLLLQHVGTQELAASSNSLASFASHLGNHLGLHARPSQLGVLQFLHRILRQPPDHGSHLQAFGP
jgi:hypothetical protein